MPEKDCAEPIAIVGSACRFPGGASSHAALAALLKDPPDVAVDIPPERFDLTAYYHPDGNHHGSTNVRQSYLLDTQDLRRFDSMFFNISPNEADSMDPQQRLLLETVYEALESGGHRMEDLRGSDTAVYTGTMSADYVDTIMRDATAVPTYAATGTNRAIISNRVSYVFDWHGPSMTIDTACSSSLIAIHLAVRTLRAGESRVALGCGTQIILNPEQFILESKLNMLSPNGRSRMWDADADGYARGEGVAAVVLKRLSDAIADGDHIQCIIRETGTNQDGHSTGITVPSSEAQAALIRDTYKRAGLHPETNADDRPQFFEAHGTGTKAGDPKEAAAIHEVFGSKTQDDAEPLYVGSIKTVIGHLEGSAGIAGVLKASAMVQHGDIYPNLLLNRLNPDIAPFYKGVEIPKQCRSWPKLPDGIPRRVSINSFGFGGSNAHAIIEQWRGTSCDKETADSDKDLQAYSTYLERDLGTKIGNLAWTLQARKSELSHRITFSASSISQLKSKIDAKLQEATNNQAPNVGTKIRVGQSAPKIMAIFTGQGAQWPSMGAQLLKSSEFVRGRMQELEESLTTLHLDERPSWSLVEQILAEGEASRLSSAEIAQPLCTAIQIILVDLLLVAGVQVQVVVGHSSGEIAAAYTAGFISAQDAIRIAYYRGRVLQSARKGAMMAAAMSWEEANELTQLPVLHGRVAIAAHNSSASVTLSGDMDGIAQAKEMLDAEKKFARLLRVDKAYHSHHMVPCGEAYVNALRSCVDWPGDRSDDSCVWFSSVKPGSSPMSGDETLQAEYWRDNMTSPVLFAEAVRNAIAYDNEIGVILEIGPHPALKGPAIQNITEVRPTAPPYSGTLTRGASDVESLSDTLGFLWTHLGSRVLDFKAYGQLFSPPNGSPRLVVGLPTCQWDHGREHWSESRRSRRLNNRRRATHELLGVLAPESTAQEMRWANVLKQSEIPWLEGHKIQGQAVFPAAGYVAMALEASKELVPSNVPIQGFELSDLSIQKAIAFEELQDSAVETLVTLTKINKNNSGAEAFFSCYALSMDKANSEAELERIASCAVTVSLKTTQNERLSVASENDYRMSEVDSERFYTHLAELGYNYSGPFRTVRGMRRKYHAAMGLIPRIPFIDEPALSYVVHPSLLDMAFQLVMLAFAAPGDGGLWALHLPTSIQRIRVDAELCYMAPDENLILLAEATTDGGSTSISSHADLMSQDRQNCWIRVENVIIKPFAPATELDDRVMFTSTKLGVAEPDAHSIVQGVKPSCAEVEIAIACERIAYFYHRKWQSEGSDADWDSSPSSHPLRAWANDTVSRASTGNHPILKREWSNDSEQYIKALASKHWDYVDVRILTAVGENLKAAIRGEITIVEDMAAGDMLDEYNRNCIGMATHGPLLAKLAKQISFRYPRTKFVEIGAGTGSCTKPVVLAVHETMSSYTYTHISNLHLDQAAETFSKFSDKMAFKVLDIRKSPEPQGFQPQSYDVAIAVNLLHATASLGESLKHVRQLLRPGGYLLLFETTKNDSIRHSTIMAGLHSWWIGTEDGRFLQPAVPTETWHAVLGNSGFSGVDTKTPEIDSVTWPFSILVSQAVDERIQMLRQPLSTSSWSMLSTPSLRIQSLVVAGAGTKATLKISDELVEHLSSFCDDITVLKGLPTDEDALELNPLSCFINLVDLESPIFKDMTSERMRGLQNMYDCAKNVLWVTEGALDREPYHMSSIAFTRTIRREAEHIGVTQLDTTDKSEPNLSIYIAEHLVRFWVLGEWATYHDDADSQQPLWSNEPEMFLEGARLMVPRLLPESNQNNRINASRRVLRKQLLVSSSNNLALEYDSTALLYDLVESPIIRQKQRICADDRIINVRHSTLMALHVVTDTFLFLVSGVDSHSGDSVIGFSATNSLYTAPVASIRLPSQARIGVPTDVLIKNVVSQVIASSIIDSVIPGARILVSCSSDEAVFIQVLCERLANSGSSIILIANDQAVKCQVQNVTLIELTRQMSQHVIRRSLQLAQPTHFLDMSDVGQERETGKDRDLGRCIVKNLPAGCRLLRPDAFFQRQSRQVALGSKLELTSRLENGVLRAHLGANSSMTNRATIAAISLQDVRKRNLPVHATSLVDWAADTPVEATIRPVDTSLMFSGDKTYILVGLSGELGQSLCEFMVAHGAGCVCLTSRRPKVDERWLSSFQQTGAKVKILSMDVTDRVAVEKVIQDIRASCPPIAGVAHGAMVLSDVFFSQMTMDQMKAVLEPKILGAVNLDDVFGQDGLDFFVLFSSVVAIAGNQGQSNYSAANAYLGSLARQRRRRGLSASVFDIGRVGGLGYFESQSQELQRQIIRTGLPPVPESDLHKAFAETILVGYSRPEDQLGLPEVAVTVGIRCFTKGENLTGHWFTNPLYSHLIMEPTATEGHSSSGTGQISSKGMMRAGKRVLEARSPEEAAAALQESFAFKLQAVLQMSDRHLDPHSPLVELGIDSLVAVEIRSWFLKELKLDIPVLKIIGGASLLDVCNFALDKLSKAFITNVNDGEASAKITTPVSEPAPPATPVSPKDDTDLSSSAPPTENGDSFPRSPSPGLSSSRECAEDHEISRLGAAHDIPDCADKAAEQEEEEPIIQIQPTLPNRKIIKKVPISFAQSGYWFLQSLVDPQSSNVSLCYRVDGEVRANDLNKALRIVCARHEALRTTFVQSDDAAIPAQQCVLARSPVRLKCESISSALQASQRFHELKNQAFDLSSGELLQVLLLTLTPTSHFLIVHYHHILMDGVSLQVFLSELESAYQNQDLGPAPQQYPDFSVAQRQAVEQGALVKELRYWRGIFPDGTQPPILPLLPIAQRSTRESRTEFDNHEVLQILSPQLSEKIRLVSQSQHATPFNFYLAAFRVLLFRFTEAESLVIGMSDAARNHSDLSNSIGFFLNLLALKFESRPSQAFKDAIVEARTTSHAALEQSRLPFNVVLSALGLDRSSAHSPLFQAFIDYRQKNPRKQGWGGCQLSVEHWHVSNAAYDLVVDVTDDPDGAVVMLRAQKFLYDAAATELLLEAYIHLLQAFASDPDACVNEPSLFTEQSKNLSLQAGRGPMMTSTWPETLVHRIDQIALDYPEKVAVMDDFGALLSYSAMMQRVEALCVALTAADVGAGDHVLVFQQASVDWICCMLAIMRTGAVYVPTDTRHPVSRLSALANDCTPKAIMTDSSTASDVLRLGVTQAQHVNISAVSVRPSAPYLGGNRARPEAAAAILYTSGSTGKPKGILLSHGGLRNQVEVAMKTCGLGAERVLHQSAFTFDHSLDQTFIGLCDGGSVYVASDQAKTNPIALTDIIQQHGITYTMATPSEYLSWLKYGRESLRRASEWSYAFSGGEMLTNTIIQGLQHLNHDNLRFFNSYGPAETHISACKGEINYKETLTENNPVRISCGYTLPNYYIFIVDDQLRPQPLGVPGELCIGGASVGIGYLNNRELTDSQFLPNPFALAPDIAQGWTRMYRTGDVAHMNVDGEMVVRGRMAGDTQVKIRGMRVDLADIESSMMAAADGVLKAIVVTLRRENDAQFLVAHVVFQPTRPVDERDSFLSNLLKRLPLPQYMVPVAAIPMDELPLTSHGKLDRKAVMAIALPSHSGRSDSLPESELTETMIRLRGLWRDLIGVKIVNLGSGIGPSTSFFHVGGNSLLIIALMSRVRAEFGVALSLVELLNAGSLQEMADAVDTAATATAIDWNKETAPPDIPSFLSDIDSSDESSSCRAGKIIIVTGGTGFLGRHLVQALAENSRVARVHCVAVRERPQDETQDLVPYDKIEYHPGDLTAPLLGLDQNTFRTLASEADAILHLGASRSMWDSYHVLRATNVLSTRELIKMASPRRTPIHFVSTIAASATGDTSLAEPSPTPSSYSADGYVSTKWASERLLQRAWDELSVPSMTYRFLPGRSQAAAPPSLLNEIVRFANVARAVPDAATWTGLLYLTPVATVSYMMQDAILSDVTHWSATVMHHECDVTLPGDEILALVGPGSAQDGWETVPILKWIGMLKKSEFSYFLAAHSASVGEGLATNR
ncbi:Beta-ketoacyl synthase [Cordyceps fumosorosea ARSEF 2679]|uniref:Beta-ketoacyl synthase n=1 Tax=Cordyceps fumosorosea (strain ARSEF 2679) TaxID=1081104 RepID=A0A167SYM3_CORFA|nr:Beta-ketoacyl synthase [Cordyceps fumosorosea ARSEF 2679]OAA60067.1 Beta-ketoacyl synthase [Cordyceps fumosorosea ARSEF 2679]